LEMQLTKEYYEVFTAVNGREAVKKAKSHQPDIILMDIMMPVMDGFAATREIKTSPDTLHIPIIMLTALNVQQDKVRGLEAGADDFLTKPIDELSLITRIKSLLRLKLMTDELRLREQTGQQFGIISN